MAGTGGIEEGGAIGRGGFCHPGRRQAGGAGDWGPNPGGGEAPAPEEGRAGGGGGGAGRGGGERGLVSGADSSEFQEQRASGGGGAEYDRESGLAFRALAGLDKPLVAMIHGFCVGGGVALALSADLRFAADDARFAIPAAR